MFDLLYGLRRNAKSQLLLLAIGFSVFGAMLTFCIAVAPKLFQLKPSWVINDATLATVGVQGQDNELAPTSLQQLDTFRDAVGVKQLATIGVHKNVSTRLQETPHKMTAALLSNNFASLLKAQGMQQHEAQWSEIAYISHDFWQTQLQSQADIVGKTVVLIAADRPLRIAGILAPEYDELMPERPQLWIANSHAAALVEINFGPASPPASFVKTLKQQIANEDTVHVGLLELSPGMTHSDIMQSTAARPTEAKQDSKIHSTNKYAGVKIIEGIELTPAAKHQLRLQWWLIFFLCLALGLVNGLNFLTSSIAQLVSRQQEINVRVAVGVTTLQLLTTLLIEQLPLLLLTAVGTALLATYSIELLAVYDLQLAQIPTSSLLFSWLTTMAVVAVLIVVIVSVTLLHICKMQHFQRGKAEQHSKLQQRLGEATMIFQLTLAGLAICFSSALIVAQWHKFNTLPIAKNLAEVAVAVTNKNKDSSAIDVNALQNILPSNVAISEQSLVLPYALAIQLDSFAATTGQKIGINLIQVSANYFDISQATLLAGQGFDGNSVILNEAAAKRLHPSAPLSLVGKNLQADEKQLLYLAENEAIRVSAIVANIPHYGVLNVNRPMIYSNLTAQTQPNLMTTHIIFDLSDKQTVETATAQFASQQGNLKVEYKQTIEQQLAAQNSTMSQLIYLALLLAAIIACLVVSSLYQQMASHLSIRQTRYGVMLAVGAQPYAVVLTIWRNLALLLSIALVPFFAVVYAVAPWVEVQLQASLLHGTAVMLSLVVMVSIVFLSSLIPCLRLTRRPVARLLYQVD